MMMKNLLILPLMTVGLMLLSFSAVHAQPCTPEQLLYPGNKCNPLIDGYPLKEVNITAPRPTYYFPLIPSPYPGPYIPTQPNPNFPGGLPCPGDIIKNPVIAPSSPTNMKGGTYGLTRNGGTKLHDGVDIKAAPGTPVFSPENGVVTNVRNTFPPNTYAAASYGNFVEISYIVNGVTVTLSFNHLNGVQEGIVKGSPVSVGQILGVSGRTGNAGDQPGRKSDIIPHVHVKAREDGKRIDPEKYLKSKFDKNTGLPSTSPCN